MENTLFSLTEEYRALLDMATDPTVDEQALFDTMEAITGEISVKAAGYIAVMNNLQGRVDMYKAEADRLTGAAKTMENNIKRMKDRIKWAMEAMGTDKIETDYNIIKIQKNGGQAPLKITGEVPQSFKKVVLENDTDKIRKALKYEELPFAHLEERGTHLRIS